MCSSVDEVLVDSEVIVVGNRDAAGADIVDKISGDQTIIDLVRIPDQVTSADGRYQGIYW